MRITTTVRTTSAVAAFVGILVAGFGPARGADAAEPRANQEVQAKKPVKGIPGIFAMDPDGSNPRPLVKIPGMRWHGSPTWSHDGTMVAFDATAAGYSTGHVYVYAVKGPFKGMLRDMGPGQCPAFSPDDSTLAFHREPGNPDGAQPGVWLMNTDGSNRHWLCDGDHAKWSPDGKKLAVPNERMLPAHIDIVTVETGKAERILDSKYAQIPGAVFSPDGKKLAFIGYADRRLTSAELIVMAVDGAPESQQVVMRGRIGWIPNWSPDGKQLTFVLWEKRDGVDFDTSYVVDADGKGLPVKLKNQDGNTRNVEAEWSPDGKTLVYASDREIDGEMKLEKSDEVRVEVGPERKLEK